MPAGQADQQGWRFSPSTKFERPTTEMPDVPETTMSQAAGYSAGVLSSPEAQGYVEGGIDSGPEAIPDWLVSPGGSDHPSEDNAREED